MFLKLILSLVLFWFSCRPYQTDSMPVDTSVVSPPLIEDKTQDTDVKNKKVRDPALWPFHHESPWNLPLSLDAKFESVLDPCTHSLREINRAPNQWKKQIVEVDINAQYWSHPIYVANDDDPFVSVYLDKTGGQSWVDPDGLGSVPVPLDGFVARIKIPRSAQPAWPSFEEDVWTDAHMHVIHSNHQSVVEMWRVRRVSSDRIICDGFSFNKLSSDGLAHGERAYGGSAIAGLIRAQELSAQLIPHALALALPRSQQKCCSPVWPASSVDNGAKGSYLGHVPLGQLVAIEDNPFDPLKLNWGSQLKTPIGRTLARTLYEYGAYNVDSSGDMAFYAEPVAESFIDRQLIYQDLKQIQSYLRCVKNNELARPGGGSLGAKRRAPLAPQL